MAKFMAIYHAPAEAMAQMATATEEQKMAGMQEWMKWKESNGSAITDMGAPLMNGQGTVDGNSWNANDNDITGYSMVEAENLESAKALFANHPHTPWHPEAKISVFECMEM